MTVTVPNEDLDFSDMKKKKKAGKKKVIEDLERELNEAKAKGDADAEANDGEHLNDFDEAELGDDPFARAEVPTGMDSGTEPWLGSDRDYSYDEVGRILLVEPPNSNSSPSFSNGFTRPFMLRIHRCSLQLAKGTPSHLLKSLGKEYGVPSSPTLQTFANGCIVHRTTSRSFYSQRWVQQDP